MEGLAPSPWGHESALTPATRITESASTGFQEFCLHIIHVLPVPGEALSQQSMEITGRADSSSGIGTHTRVVCPRLFLTPGSEPSGRGHGLSKGVEACTVRGGGQGCLLLRRGADPAVF